MTLELQQGRSAREAALAAREGAARSLSGDEVRIRVTWLAAFASVRLLRARDNRRSD